jgi:hypothetical protein
MTDQSRIDSLHYVRIPVRWSKWRKIQDEAKAERREATDQAGLILERHADRIKPTEQVA